MFCIVTRSIVSPIIERIGSRYQTKPLFPFYSFSITCVPDSLCFSIFCTASKPDFAQIERTSRCRISNALHSVCRKFEATFVWTIFNYIIFKYDPKFPLGQVLAACKSFKRPQRGVFQCVGNLDIGINQGREYTVSKYFKRSPEHL